MKIEKVAEMVADTIVNDGLIFVFGCGHSHLPGLDTFNGVLAVYLAEGKTLAESAKYATAASGISVTKKHVMGAIPFKNEIERIMSNE